MLVLSNFPHVIAGCLIFLRKKANFASLEIVTVLLFERLVLDHFLEFPAKLVLAQGILINSYSDGI